MTDFPPHSQGDVGWERHPTAWGWSTHSAGSRHRCSRSGQYCLISLQSILVSYGLRRGNRPWVAYQDPTRYPLVLSQAPMAHHMSDSIDPRFHADIRRNKLRAPHGHKRIEARALHAGCVPTAPHRQHIHCRRRCALSASDCGQHPSSRPLTFQVWSWKSRVKLSLRRWCWSWKN
ncbi:hypothetical protein BDW62DRAFT_55413 [Aspergillus aurantiobrunneus]